MYGRFIEALRPFCEKIKSIAEKGYNAYILAHSDVDGLVSASIVSLTLMRLGAKCVTRAFHDISDESIREIQSDSNGFCILCDVGINMASSLANELDNRWIMIDHHRPLSDVPDSLYDSNIMDAFKNNIDGRTEISSGGLAYFLANQIERSNWDLSPIAIVSALAENQDNGDKKILTGLNSEIMEVARSHGLLTAEPNLRFAGQETRPIHEAMASTVTPFMDGITGNQKNAYSIVKSTGIKLIENGRWRVVADLRQEEKTVILETIVKFVSNNSRYNSSNLTDELVGYTYTFSCEDLRSPLRDAREYSMLLNACGKAGRPGIGIGVCMGDRNLCLSEGGQLANQFKAALRKCVASAENWRINLEKYLVVINGENVIDEDIVQHVAIILFRSLIFANRAIILWTRGRNGMHKFYCKAGLNPKSDTDLSMLVDNCAKSAGGIGGGSHKNEGVCRVPSVRFDDFLSCIKRVIIEFNSKNYA